MGLFKKTKKEESCCCGNVDDLILKEEQENEEEACGCGCEGGCKEDGCCEIPEDNQTEGPVIKILGSGCKNCITLTENVHKALAYMNIQAKVVKVTDFAEITGYGVMSTPALVINEKVVSYGKVLKPEEAQKILEKYLEQ
jgi:small redox-active disulfide protein 2